MCDDWDDNAKVEYEQPQQSSYSRSQNTHSSDWKWDGQASREYSNSSHRSNMDDRRSNYKGDQRNRNGGGRNEGTTIKVPSKFVGRIIGRGGSKISNLQLESGARINVTKETDGDETLVKLIGDSDAVAKAESLIRELTEQA